jgi:hypothetical protein
MKSFTGSGSTLPVHSIKACVVYDTSDGRIYHQHRVLTLKGGYEPQDDEMAADALRFLGPRHEAKRATLGILNIHHEAMTPGRRFRVHPERKELLADGP